jgi:hypothetical protein
MLEKLNPWQLIAAIGIIAGCTTALVLTGHKADIGTVAAGIGAIALALLNVVKPTQAQVDKAQS